jgi:hypothetical protein
MELDTAIGAAEHAKEQGHTSYMARAAVALAAEVKRLRMKLQTEEGLRYLAEQRTLGDRVSDGRGRLGRPGADSRTLGSAS